MVCHAMKRRTTWVFSSSATIAVAALSFASRWFAGCTAGSCGAECPSGTIPDATGCTCLQGGPTCPPNDPQPVQDGGAVLTNCCPREVLQSTARVPPVGACTGRPKCFVAVHQVCPGAGGDLPGGAPLDEYTCLCDGMNWQCTIQSMGDRKSVV